MRKGVTALKKVKRLAVILTGLGSEQLLEIPRLDSGTKSDCAQAVVEVMNEWNIADSIKALCFDTTSVNTGNNKF